MIPRICAILLSATLLLPGCSAEPTVPPAALGKFERVEALLADEMAKQGVPGLSAAIVVDNQIVWAKGLGTANKKTDAPATPTTVYRIASLSKPITATAVMQLVEAGKISLDEPVQTYCPAFPAKQWPVTVRHLLAHQGGVRHYKTDAEKQDTRHYPTIASSLEVFKNDPLDSQPGTRFSYSTYAYSILGCAVEGASGQPFLEYLQEKVFRPAGMTATTVLDPHTGLDGLAPGYEKGFLGVKEVPPFEASRIVPGGGLASTAEDLARFAIALQEGRLVSKEPLALMWKEEKTPDGKGTSYALGWNVAEKPDGLVVAHTGDQDGVTAFLYLLPGKGFAFVLLMNLEDAERRVEIARQVAAIVLQ